MSSMDDTDLIGWNSPTLTIDRTNQNLHKPLLPSVLSTHIPNFSINNNVPLLPSHQDEGIQNPFDDITDKISNVIQNPFDEMCHLIEKQTMVQQNKEHDSNLLNITLFSNNDNAGDESLDILHLSSVNDKLTDDDDVLHLSSLNDELLADSDSKNEDDVIRFLSFDEHQTNINKKPSNNFLSQSDCQFTSKTSRKDLLNNSLDDIQHCTVNDTLDVTCDEDQCLNEICQKLENSFNRSKKIFEQIKIDDRKIIATFKRRSADFCNRKENQDNDEEMTADTKYKVPELPPTNQFKSSFLKPLESQHPQLKLKSLATKSNCTKSRVGPMKAVAPLQSMMKKSQANVQEKMSIENKPDESKTKMSSLYKSSYHKSPVKKLVLRSKSANTPNKVPPLASSTPEKSSPTTRHNSLSSLSPLKSNSNSSNKMVDKLRSSSLSRLKQPKVSTKSKFNFVSDEKENIAVN